MPPTKQALTPTERVVRQAIVCAYVRGMMRAGGLMQEPPRDSDMVREALDAAESMPDLHRDLAKWAAKHPAVAMRGRDATP